MTWSKILQEHRTDIKEAMLKAYRNGLEAPGQRFVVYINADGEVWIGNDVSGGNSYPEVVHRGEAIEVETFDRSGVDVLDDWSSYDVIEGIMDYMTPESKQRFDELCSGLDAHDRDDEYQRCKMLKGYFPKETEAYRENLIDDYVGEWDAQSDELIDSIIADVRAGENYLKAHADRDDAR